MTKPKTILIIEDDSTMLRGLEDNFHFREYQVLTANDGRAGMQLALSARPDLIVLDIMLPYVNGYEICQAVRTKRLQMPIIMLSAKGRESDIIRGLDLGADDYVTKPFSINELLARAAAFLRRGGFQEETKERRYRFGICSLDLDARTFVRDGEPISLTPREFELLVYFVTNPYRARTRRDILDAVWGYHCLATTRTVDRFVNTLRQKISPSPDSPSHIETLRQVGYKFRPDS